MIEMVEEVGAPKKGRNWLLIGCISIGVIGALCVICVAGSMVFMTSDAGQAVMSTAVAQVDATMGVVPTRTPRPTRTAEAAENSDDSSDEGEGVDPGTLDAIATAAASSGGDGDEAEPESGDSGDVLPVVGDDVEVGEVRWKVLSAEDLGNTLTATNEFAEDATSSGKFIRVSFEIENLASAEQSLWSVDIEDEQGRVFGTYDEYYLYVPDDETCILESLNPNLAKVCTYVFEVPADAVGLAFRASDLGFLEPRTELINLGLE
jgi:hypothetical protein